MPGRDVDTALRVVHDLTQALWLGGAAMGAIALESAAAVGPDERARIHGVDRAWQRWQRVSTPAIALHLVSGAGLTVANRGRLGVQRGGGRTSLMRTGLTGVALASELTARGLGRRLGQHGTASTAEGGSGGEERSVRGLRRQVKVAQWVDVLTLTAMVAVGARMGEQQRPRELLRGVASRLRLAA